MGFAKIENSITFCLFCIILLFGISSFLLISDYIQLPIKGSESFMKENPDYIVESPYIEKLVQENKSRFWEIKIGNGFISNIENVIIYVCMLWGIMRTIDLMILLNRYKPNKNL